MTSRIPALLLALLVVSACSDDGTPHADATTPAPVLTPTASPTPCPAVPTPAFAWPSAVPRELPKPPSSTFVSTSTSADEVTIVRLSSNLSLQQSVLFVLRNAQKAGFTLGRGDAEPAEADAPFGKGDIRGIYKMVTRDSCKTDWLIAVARVRFGQGSPVLPTASRGPSSSPLPFG